MEGTRKSVSTILAIGLLASSAAGVAAQDDAAQDGAAEPGAPVEFTAEWLFGPEIRYGDTEIDGQVVRSAGSAWRPGAMSAATDPRFQGTITISANSDDYSAIGGPTIWHSAFRVENDEGAWQQEPYFNLGFADDPISEQVAMFVGEGGYEGLFAVVEIITDSEMGSWDLRGAIIDGELPPGPDPSMDA